MQIYFNCIVGLFSSFCYFSEHSYLFYVKEIYIKTKWVGFVKNISEICGFSVIRIKWSQDKLIFFFSKEWLDFDFWCF